MSYIPFLSLLVSSTFRVRPYFLTCPPTWVSIFPAVHNLGYSLEQPAPFGRYKNIFLSESEYAELKEEYPDRLERLIEEMSEFIAATGNDYVCHAAALRRWLNREKKENPKKGIPDYSYKEGESL